MKNSIRIIGSVGIAAIASIFAFQSWNSDDPIYSQESLNALEQQEALGAQQWLSARYVDQETGLPLSREKLSAIEASLKNLPKTKSASFIEQGPDNIGGRTRTIHIDRLDHNTVWTGGVSGGLFKSINGGDTWEHVTSYEGVGSPIYFIHRSIL